MNNYEVRALLAPIRPLAMTVLIAASIALLIVFGPQFARHLGSFVTPAAASSASVAVSGQYAQQVLGASTTAQAGGVAPVVRVSAVTHRSLPDLRLLLLLAVVALNVVTLPLLRRRTAVPTSPPLSLATWRYSL